MMRVGLVSGEFPPMQGGVGDYTRELARALAALGVEVHVITRETACCSSAAGGWRGGALAPRGASGDQKIATAERFTLHAIVRRWSFPALWQIRALARRIALDWLDIQYQAAAYDLGAPIHFLPDIGGRPAVVTFHDLRMPYLFPKAGCLRPAAVTHLARAARGAIAVEPADAVELHRRGVRRVAAIPIGSNIAPAPPAGYERAVWRARLGVEPADFLLGYFGFLNSSKGGEVLIEALADLAGRGAPVKLVLIGGQVGSSDAAANAAFSVEVERLINRLNLADRVRRTGFVAPAEVSAYLLACDVLVLPYRDGVSLRRGSFMAAIAHGCVVVTTQPAMPLPEIRHGENVWLVPPASASAVAQAVAALMAAPAVRSKLGAGARELAALFSWEVIARRTLEFLDSLP